MIEHRRRLESQLSMHDRIAGAITERIGTMRFAYFHLAVVVGWIVWNTALPVPRFDPFPFVGMAMICSVEAIFLTIFVLVSQVRMADLQDRRAELDVQIGLVSEREITRVLAMVTAIARRLGIEETPTDADELARDLAPEEILDQIDAQRDAPEK